MSVKRVFQFVLELMKCMGIALVASLALELLFALILKWTYLSAAVITPVNQVIKVIALFLGCFFGLNGEMGIVKGLIVGFLSTLLFKFVFSFLAGNFSFDLFFLLELLFGTIVGAICGVLSVNLRRK